MRELKRRLVDRNTESEEKVMERFETAYREINELSKYNYVIVNDTKKGYGIFITTMLEEGEK